MKKARMNVSHFRFILFNFKIFGEIVTTKILYSYTYSKITPTTWCYTILVNTFSLFFCILCANDENLVPQLSSDLKHSMLRKYSYF